MGGAECHVVVVVVVVAIGLMLGWLDGVNDGAVGDDTDKLLVEVIDWVVAGVLLIVMDVRLLSDGAKVAPREGT